MFQCVIAFLAVAIAVANAGIIASPYIAGPGLIATPLLYSQIPVAPVAVAQAIQPG